MESNEELHPSVQQFKEFMRQHPLLINEVREERKSLQNLFEEWSILGAEHEQWQAYKQVETNQSTDSSQDTEQDEQPSQSATATLGQIMSLLRRVNVQDLQNHLSQFSSVLTNVQGVIQSFQRPNDPPSQGPQDHPFSFWRD
ncbi:YlbD family protein [Halalkalibacter nanhaiisediminis]|uniref:Putative coat protein YlbD-like n=1 Tax=Halalkalibacter nanhaiisediminis TaxID=688079 RepID=A0A562QGC2_9BACI|nr:YlbD family protein [Halalkalibacter nanhaiisediminis]TWI55807.1 putative coat protein YlbD-like [Halalkalibacter nanhaiisediminis]